MGQVAVTTSTTTLDTGTAGVVVLRNLGPAPARISNVNQPTSWLMPSCSATMSPGGSPVTAVTASGSTTIDVTAHAAPDVLQGNGLSGVQTRISGKGALVTRASAPVLADLAPGEVALAVDGSGNLKAYSNVAGVLKVGTVTVA